MGKRILIIKLAAVGDVLRTTPLLHALKRKYPLSYIVWLTESDAAELLRHNNLIDKVLVSSYESFVVLLAQEFDLLMNFDKDINAAAIASIIKAKKKIGFGLNAYGNLCPLNSESDYIFRLGFTDELKFKKNKLSYQEMCFSACSLDYKKDEYILSLPQEKIKQAREFWRRSGVKEGNILIGLNTGAGKVFATKRWPVNYFIDLAKKLSTLPGVKLALLGGPLEVAINKRILSSLNSSIIDTGCKNGILEFASLMQRCNLVVTSDTLAMHLAIAQGVAVLALFGPTAEQEVELYGRGIKLKSAVSCTPCYKNECKTLECMSNITPKQVFEACSEILSSRKGKKKCNPR